MWPTKQFIASLSSGVPQGTVLVPLLFLCFINDIPNRISYIKNKVIKYADDVLLYTTIYSQDDCHNLATTGPEFTWKSGQLTGK